MAKKPQTKGPATQHVDYVAMLGKWKRCRDVSKGQDAVHAAGTDYLPILREQVAEEYRAYVMRTPFYNATWRTIAGLNGMIFRKPPIVTVPPAIKDMMDDVTLSGVSIHILAQSIAEECLTVGRAGVLVDYPQADGVATQADAAPLNLRPKLAVYRAESIINWRSASVGNVWTLALVVLCEHESTLADEYTEVQTERYRVLDLDPATGKYRQRIFTADANGKVTQLGADIFPRMGAKPMDFIPFAFIGPDDTTPEVDEPPLIDLVNTNLSHYRNAADREHGAHFTGLPTAYVAGYTKQNENEKLYIGSSSAWVFTDPNAKAAYLEFTGQGLKALQDLMQDKERQMAVLGARMLEELKRGVESAETAGIHRVGEQSALASISQSVSIGLSRALTWFALWAGAKGEASIELNRRFYPTPVSGPALTALVASWQSGAISYESLFDQLQQGEVIASDRTVEQERGAIDAAPPSNLNPPAPPPGPGDGKKQPPAQA